MLSGLCFALQALNVYMAQLREYRALQGELEPWTVAFAAENGRKATIRDVEAAGQSCLARGRMGMAACAVLLLMSALLCACIMLTGAVTPPATCAGQIQAVESVLWHHVAP